VKCTDAQLLANHLGAHVGQDGGIPVDGRALYQKLDKCGKAGKRTNGVCSETDEKLELSVLVVVVVVIRPQGVAPLWIPWRTPPGDLPQRHCKSPERIRSVAVVVSIHIDRYDGDGRVLWLGSTDGGVVWWWRRGVDPK
jgi:hypothetical protein